MLKARGGLGWGDVQNKGDASLAPIESIGGPLVRMLRDWTPLLDRVPLERRGCVRSFLSSF